MGLNRETVVLFETNNGPMGTDTSEAMPNYHGVQARSKVGDISLNRKRRCVLLSLRPKKANQRKPSRKRNALQLLKISDDSGNSLCEESNLPNGYSMSTELLTVCLIPLPHRLTVSDNADFGCPATNQNTSIPESAVDDSTCRAVRVGKPIRFAVSASTALWYCAETA